MNVALKKKVKSILTHFQQGKLGEYKLGRFLKSHYGDFLGPDYTLDKVTVRATDVTRTKMSAELVMAGLFPPSSSLVWNPDLLWLPVPINYKSANDEDVYTYSSSLINH